MKPLSLIPVAIVVATLLPQCMAASWGFTDATVSVQGKGSGVGSGLKEKLTPNKPLTKIVAVGGTDTLKIILTTQEGKTAKKPHQAFLLLKDSATGLDVSYPFTVKETGKGKVDLTHKDLPSQFLRSGKPLDASIVVASFGSHAGYNSRAFPLSITLDPDVPIAAAEKPLRYSKLPEIHHIFRTDPKSPNILISLVFSTVLASTLPVLVGAWLLLGANLNHLSQAFQAAPVSHATFFGSIVALEGALGLYYTSWKLYQALPALAAIGVITFISGSRALSEVQARRLESRLR